MSGMKEIPMQEEYENALEGNADLNKKTKIKWVK